MGLGPLAALLGQRVVVVVQRRRSGVDEDLAGTQRVKDPLQEAERQANRFGNASTAGGADNRQMLANERLDEPGRQSRFFHGPRDGRPEVLLGQNRCQRVFTGFVSSDCHTAPIDEVLAPMQV